VVIVKKKNIKKNYPLYGIISKKIKLTMKTVSGSGVFSTMGLWSTGKKAVCGKRPTTTAGPAWN
jgi:hypothetical protein